jgi:hypothetical protein
MRTEVAFNRLNYDSSFTSLAGQVANDVDRSTELSKDVLRALQEAVQAIEGNLGPHLES